MKCITVRQLRQQASDWLRQVEAGEAFQVTNRGRPVALLIPMPRSSTLDQLVKAGRAVAAEGDLLELTAPLPPREGQPLPSVILAAVRATER